MPIKFHCNHCNKVIKAPDDAGGKHGRCPNCKQEVYVPMPDDQLEEIPLAPMDDEAARRERELAEEDRALLGDAAREASDSGGRERGSRGQRAQGAAPKPRPVANVRKRVIDFLLAMQASELEKADGIAAELKGSADRTREEVERLMVDDIPPPELEDVPPPLYKGFLRSLLERL